MEGRTKENVLTVWEVPTDFLPVGHTMTYHGRCGKLSTVYGHKWKGLKITYKNGNNR